MTYLFKNALTLVCVVLLFASCKKLNEPGNLVPKTVDQDPSLPSIVVNGIQLHSEAFGNPDSSIIVCIHGGPGADYRYLYYCQELAGYGYRVVFYDQVGSGLSQRMDESHYEGLGDGALDKIFYNELLGVINTYKTHPSQKVFLLGQSWGAMLATAFTGKHPDVVDGLAVIEPGGLQWNDVIEYITKSRSFKLWGELSNDATYKDQFISDKKNNHELLDYKFGMISTTNTITGDKMEPEGQWRSGVVISMGSYEIGDKLKPDFSSGIDQFKKPVLFIYGGQNKAYPDSWATKISDAYPSKTVVKINAAGHSGMFTDRDIWTSATLPQLLTYFNSLK
jgi:proline iminopeptidase